METIVHLQEFLFSMFSNVYGLGPGRVRAVVPGRIKALFTGIQQIASVAAVDVFFLTADGIWAFSVR
jgi:hypothetical protein